jgi:aminoglycoside/choline kinase family phosphotransferase
MDTREQQLKSWLKESCQLPSSELEPLIADASFRRYFRVNEGNQSFVAMDAPPAKEPSTPQFVAITDALRARDLQTPEVIAKDLQQGFLLLTDFGNRLYLKELQTRNAKALYEVALSALSVLQACREVKDYSLPSFTAEFMHKELLLFKEWFLLGYLKLSLTAQQDNMLEDFFYCLAESAALQPQVFMHRDYHSANLLVLPESQVGILDFQDAFMGPVTYDLVSLLRDCYIAWPENFVRRMALRYKGLLPELKSVTKEEFMRWFDIMGMQRHLKSLLTFSRKFLRDENPNYLQHMPRTLKYITAAAPLYPESRAFNLFLLATILPAFEKVSTQCAQ